MKVAHMAATGRANDGVASGTVRKRHANKRFTSRRVWRFFLRAVKLVLLVAWEVTKFAAYVAWELFRIYLFVFLKIVSLVMRTM